MNSLAGHLLIAPSDEQDPDFIKTVILLIQHIEEQAFGVVLNRPTATKVREACTAVKRCQCDGVVYSGGPVPGPLIALHTNAALGGLEVLSGVHYSIQKKQIEQLLHAEQQTLKVFESHVGWGQGQLEQFVATGPWRTMPATSAHVFSPDADLWEKLAAAATS